MSTIGTALEHIQNLSGPKDAKWNEAWLNLIRLVEAAKAEKSDEPVDVKARARERFAELFGPKIAFPEESE